MTAWGWVQALAAASGVLVAVLAVVRGGVSPLALPLALLSVDQFAWNAASVALELTGNPAYAWVGVAAAPLFVPCALHFALVFIGRSKRHRAVLAGAYGVFGLQALAAGVAGLSGAADVGPFSVVLLVTAVPTGLWGLSLLARHLRAATERTERWRAWLVLGAVFAFVALGSTDLLADLHLGVPRLATLGSFAFNAAATHLTLGLGLFSVERRGLALVQAALLSVFVSVASVGLVVLLRERLAVLALGFAVLSLAVLALVRVMGVQSAQRRAGLERMAVLGRFSAQMAHDLKNPLGAAKGALAFLAEELRQGRPIADADFVTLAAEQVDRVVRIIDRYQSLSKLELRRAPTDVAALVEKVAKQFRASWPEHTLQVDVPASGLQASVDADLVASAVENLVKNALDATPAGGTVTVRGVLDEAHDEPQLSLDVRDTGSGMDARTQEQAFELFFTSKATGTGLGLAFVRQVARAHGGEVTLSSAPGRGTTVRLVLPTRAPTRAEAP